MITSLGAKFWVSKYKVRQSWPSTRQDPDGAKILLDRRRRSSKSSPHLNICPRSYSDTRIAVIWIVTTWIVTTRIILNLKSLIRVETNTSEEEQQHCCLDSVIVDFAALGWHFILSPPVLEFTYCRLLSLTFVVVCHCFCFPWFAFHPLPTKTNPRVHLPQVFNINICQVSQENTQKPIEAEAEQTLFSCQGKIVRKISVKHYKSLKW